MKRGLFTVSYAGLWGQQRLTLEESVDRAAELGFDGVLLMAKRPHLSPLDYREERLEALSERLRDRGLETIGLAAYNDFLLQGPAEIPVVEMQLAYIERCCRISAALGGTLVRIFTGYESPNAPVQAQWSRVAEILREAGERAARHGVTLAVQNHHDLAVDTAAMELLLAEVDHPGVQAGFDAWSPFLRGEDLYSAARRMAPNTVLSIAANYRRIQRYRYLPELVNYERVEPDMVRAESMSGGEIDYTAFLAGLRDGGYDGPLVYEMCSPLAGGGEVENLDAKARDFISFCDRFEEGRN